MITYANLTQIVAAHLLAHPGERLTLTLQQLKNGGIKYFHELVEWTEKHGLQCRAVGTNYTFWQGELPPQPSTFTSIDQLHPGNRFRMMFGQPLLPQSPTDGHPIQSNNA